MQLDQCGEHNASSDDDAQSRYLKYNQIIVVTDALTTAQQQYAAQLRRDVQLAGTESQDKHIVPDMLRCVHSAAPCASFAGPVDCQASAGL